MDDADSALGNSSEYTTDGILAAMPATRRLLAEEGATFSSFYVNSPLCCPSRVEILTGRYFHNVGGPNGKCQGADPAEIVGPMALFPQLKAGGYETIAVGKLVNDQADILCGTAGLPPSIDAIDTLCGYK